MRRTRRNDLLPRTRDTQDPENAEVDPLLRLPAPARALRRVERRWKADELQLRETLGRQARRQGNKSGWDGLSRDERPLTAEDVLRAYNKLNAPRNQKTNQ